MRRIWFLPLYYAFSLVIHTSYFLLQRQARVQQSCPNSFWDTTHSIVTVKWSGCKRSTKWPIVEPTLKSWTWTGSNVDWIIGKAMKTRCQSWEYKAVSFCVRTRHTVLPCACVATFLPVIVVCNVPRDALASMTPLGRPMWFNVPAEAIMMCRHSYPWMPHLSIWMETILQAH